MQVGNLQSAACCVVHQPYCSSIVGGLHGCGDRRVVIWVWRVLGGALSEGRVGRDVGGGCFSTPSPEQSGTPWLLCTCYHRHCFLAIQPPLVHYAFLYFYWGPWSCWVFGLLGFGVALGAASRMGMSCGCHVHGGRACCCGTCLWE